jgi:hypothetical protein
LSLSFQISWFVFLLAALIGAAISFFVYRYTIPSVSRAKRYVLTVLRSCALLLIVFVLCEPLFTLTRQSTLSPLVAVLVDNSLSMTLTNNAGNREQQLHSLLSSATLKQLSTALRVVFYSFSSSLRENTVDSLQLNGTTTDIALALRSLKRKSLPQLKAVLLLSDGNYNAGENPLYEAEKFDTPVFSVGIGDSVEQKDILVQKLLTNSVAYVQSAVPLDATIKVAGFQNKKLAITLLEDGKQVDQQFLSLQSSPAQGASEYPVHFSLMPTADGIKKYTVSVSGLEGEITKKNNAKSVLMKVLKNKMHVAVIAGAPNADVSAVMQALHADPNIEATLFVQQPDGLFRSSASRLRPNGSAAPSGIFNQQISQIIGQTFSSTDCVALVDFPTDATATSALQLLSNALSSRSLPLFFVAGRTINIRKLRQLDSLLPFTVVSDRIDEQLVFPNISPLHQYHVLVQGNANSSGDWNKLPPIFSSLATFKAKPEALVLSTTKIQGVAIDDPLLIARSVAQEKSFAVAGYGIWRWRLLAGASTETEKFFDPWLSNVVRWLVTREDNKQVQVEPSKEIFSQGEAVDFLGQAYNANYQPLDNADIRVEIVSLTSKQRYGTILQPMDKGRYEGAIESLPEGDYAFSATAALSGVEIGKTQGRFSVGEQSIEFADTRMNKSLLQQIAAVSGGEYADAAQFDRLIRDIASRPSMRSEEQITTSEIELWNLPTLLSVIIALLGFEWFLRKRSGML